MEKNHTKYMTMLKHGKKQYKVHENVKTCGKNVNPLLINHHYVCDAATKSHMADPNF